MARVKQLKQGSENNPNIQIPELGLLSEQDWLQAAKWFGRRPQLDAETDFRVAMAEVRQSAQNAFAARAQHLLSPGPSRAKTRVTEIFLSVFASSKRELRLRFLSCSLELQCTWSCALDHSSDHVIIACVWSKAEYVAGFVRELASKHNLTVFDPQSSTITYPEGSSGKSWWKVW